eukprot:12041640-Ditylum_brightwellii.AAC.1
MLNCVMIKRVILTEDVSLGEAFILSYSELTNPAKCLATDDFLNNNAPVTYCKLLISAPSAKLK